MTGGPGDDTFPFRFFDPQSGHDQSFTTVTDFGAAHDTFAFDAIGVGQDSAGANFIDHGDGTSGGSAQSFFSGAAADAHGESVVGDKGFDPPTASEPFRRGLRF